jgi:hypothetical protein
LAGDSLAELHRFPRLTGDLAEFVVRLADMVRAASASRHRTALFDAAWQAREAIVVDCKWTNDYTG